MDALENVLGGVENSGDETLRTGALGRVREELVHLHKVGVDGPEMTTKVSDVELAKLEVPDCFSFGWFEETEKRSNLSAD